ncbi:hypothetical protein ACWDRR_25080 [Kitasatospora sp. NPDC003701]
MIGDRPFLTRRLRGWTLLRAVAPDEPWTARELTGAADRFRRTASAERIATSTSTSTSTSASTSTDALGLPAERGRTRRVRNAASRRLRLRRPDRQPS